jgi:endonuclease YncB( thermonuclease family)
MLAGLLSAEPPSPGLTFDATCIRVLDGDTIECESTVRYQIRLIDCWAPESRTKDLEEKRRGMKSKVRLIELAVGEPLRITIPLTGDLTDATTLSRFLGRAWLADGRELSEIMVSEGLATKTKTQTERR